MRKFILEILGDIKRELNKMTTSEIVVAGMFFGVFLFLVITFVILLAIPIIHNFGKFLLVISPFVLGGMGAYYLKKYLNSRDDI